MNETEKHNIARFIGNTAMSDAVYNILLNSFLKERTAQDVYTLAASRLAIDYFKQGWKELEKCKDAVRSGTKDTIQIGL